VEQFSKAMLTVRHAVKINSQQDGMIFAAVFAMNENVVCRHKSAAPQRSLRRIDQRSAKLVLLFRCEIREGQSPLVPPALHLSFSGARTRLDRRLDGLLCLLPPGSHGQQAARQERQEAPGGAGPPSRDETVVDFKKSHVRLLG